MAAGDWSTIMIIMTGINIFMYIGLGTQGTYLFNGDTLSQFITMDINKTDQTFLEPGAAQNFSLKSNITTIPERNPLASIPGVSVVAAFLDGLDRAYDFVKLIGNIVFAPITLFLYGGMPFFISFLMIPFSMLYIASIMQFIRGAS